eukprot:55445_1
MAATLWIVVLFSLIVQLNANRLLQQATFGDCSGCLSPITGECDALSVCPPRPYCPTDRSSGWYTKCNAYPRAQCRYTGCGGCTEYFADSMGNIIQDCNVDVCALPAATGPCRAAFPRYFYNSNTGQCESFTFGGCDGNGNNFETLQECQSSCPRPICGGFGADCASFHDGCNDCKCFADGTQTCTKRTCIAFVVLEPKCTSCAWGYQLDENNECVAKQACSIGTDCDNSNGFVCTVDPICRGQISTNPLCTNAAKVCARRQWGIKCTNDFDCDTANGYACTGFNSIGLGICFHKYQ